MVVVRNLRANGAAHAGFQIGEVATRVWLALNKPCSGRCGRMRDWPCRGVPPCATDASLAPRATRC